MTLRPRIAVLSVSIGLALFVTIEAVRHFRYARWRKAGVEAVVHTTQLLSETHVPRSGYYYSYSAEIGSHPITLRLRRRIPAGESVIAIYDPNALKEYEKLPAPRPPFEGIILGSPAFDDEMIAKLNQDAAPQRWLRFALIMGPFGISALIVLLVRGKNA